MEKSKANPQFMGQVQYILYRLADQRSLIGVNRSFHIFYCDSMGRSAPIQVKKVIGQFLREECGACGGFEDVSGKEVLARNIGFLKAEGGHGRVVLSAATATLNACMAAVAAGYCCCGENANIGGRGAKAFWVVSTSGS